MPAPSSWGAILRAIANASSGPSSRVPLSMAKLVSPEPGDAADHITSSGPNAPTNSADVSSAPVRSSASSLSDMRSSERAAGGEILHHRADAKSPVLAFVAVAHAVDELAELRRADGDDVIALVGKAVPGRVAI